MKQITVATYNIRHGHDVGLDWHKLATPILESGADIVGIQEMDMGTNRVRGMDSLTGLSEATGLHYALFVPAMDFDGGLYGTAILSRYPITASEVNPLPSAGYEPRSFGCVTVTLADGSPLTFLNTHLSYEAVEQRLIQIRHLAHWMESHIPEDTPALLTGDFNTEDFSVFTPVNALGYATVNSAETEFKTFRGYPLAIDNILYRESLMTPVARGMIDKDTSDHNLLWCEFHMN